MEESGVIRECQYNPDKGVEGLGSYTFGRIVRLYVEKMTDSWNKDMVTVRATDHEGNPLIVNVFNSSAFKTLTAKRDSALRKGYELPIGKELSVRLVLFVWRKPDGYDDCAIFAPSKDESDEAFMASVRLAVQRRLNVVNDAMRAAGLDDFMRKSVPPFDPKDENACSFYSRSTWKEKREAEKAAKGNGSKVQDTARDIQNQDRNTASTDDDDIRF